jgi:adenylosuccinate synthase
VLARYAARLNSVTELAITKLDVLDKLPVIKICLAYRYNSEILREMPPDTGVFSLCQPVYEELPGWQTSTLGITSFKKLPRLAKKYLNRVEELTGVKIKIISTGSARTETIFT